MSNEWQTAIRVYRTCINVFTLSSSLNRNTDNETTKLHKCINALLSRSARLLTGMRPLPVQSSQGRELSFHNAIQCPIRIRSLRRRRRKTLLLIQNIDSHLPSSLSGSCLKRIFLIMIFFFPIISHLSHPWQYKKKNYTKFST